MLGVPLQSALVCARQPQPQLQSQWSLEKGYVYSVLRMRGLATLSPGRSANHPRAVMWLKGAS